MTERLLYTYWNISCQPLPTHCKLTPQGLLPPVSQMQELRPREGRHLPKVTQLGSGRVRIRTQVCVALNL